MVDLPFDIVYQGFLFKIMESKKENAIEIALISKPYGSKGNIKKTLIFKLFYYLIAEGFIDEEIELD
jgi:hypothetical protein